MYNLLILTIKKNPNHLNKKYNLNFYRNKKVKVIVKLIDNKKVFLLGDKFKKKTFIICDFPKIREYSYIIKYLHHNNFFWGIAHLKCSPTLKLNILNYIKILLLKKNKIFSMLMSLKNLFKTLPDPKFIVSNDKNLIFKNIKKNHVKLFITTNNFNFDNCLDIKKKKIGIKENFILYLDEGLYCHDDHIYMNFKNSHLSNKNDFIINLKNFFRKVEKKYKMPVYISLYPRFNYKNQKKIFNGFKTFKGNTALLVRNSKLIIGHTSTALDYPVIFEKPINLIDSLNFNTYLKLNIKNLQTSLKLNLIDLENGVSNLNFEVIKKNYSEYKKLYIGNDNQKKKSYELIHMKFVEYTKKNKKNLLSRI